MANPTASSRLSWRALVALLLALVLVASACGDDGTLADLADSGDLGDGDSGDDAEAGEPESDGDGDGDAASGDDTDGDDMDDGDLADGDLDDGDDMDGGDDVGFDGSGSSAYCSFAAQQEELDDDFNPLAGPDAVEDYFTEVLDLIDQAIGIVPDEIRDDFVTLREGFSRFVQVLSDNDWDFLAAQADLEALTDDPAFNAASERIDAYDEQVCGLDDDAFDTSDAGDDPFADPDALAGLLQTEFGRQAFAEGMASTGDITVEQGLCLVDNLDLDLLMGLATAEGTPSAEAQVNLFEAFDACGIEPGVILDAVG